MEDILLLKLTIFPIVDTCLICEDIARHSCDIWCPDGDFWRLFCVPYFQLAACSTFQTKFTLELRHVHVEL